MTSAALGKNSRPSPLVPALLLGSLRENALKGFGLQGGRTDALAVDRIEAANCIADDEEAFGKFRETLVMALEARREAMWNYL